MTRILLTGVTGVRNRGVEALVRTTLHGLGERVRDLQATVLSGTPGEDRGRLGGDVAFLLDVFDRAPSPPRALRRRLSDRVRRLDPGWQALKEAIAAVDAVVVTGGDLFSAHYDIAHHLRPLRIALDAGRPVVFLAQSIGPFASREAADEWLSVGEHSPLITLRERRSYDYVSRDLGLNGGRVAHTADPAFLLRPAPPKRVARLRRFYGIDPARHTLAIAPSAGIASYEQAARDRHADGWATAIRRLLDEIDAQVVLVPHVQDPTSEFDDRVAATAILERLDYSPDVRLVGADHGAADFKGLIATASLVVAERMHAAVAGLSSGRCTIPIGYSVKARGILEDLLGEARTDQLLGSIDEVLEPGRIVDRIMAAWHVRDTVSAELDAVLPTARERAQRNFDLVAELLRPAAV